MVIYNQVLVLGKLLCLRGKVQTICKLNCLQVSTSGGKVAKSKRITTNR